MIIFQLLRQGRAAVIGGMLVNVFVNYKKSVNFKKDFLIIGSSHNLREIRIKELQKIKIIFISSIFKRNKNYLGIYKFKNLCKNTSLKIIALGGISKLNEKKLKLLNCIGFAGISYFE